MKTAKLDETRPKLIHFNMLRQGSKTFAVACVRLKRRSPKSRKKARLARVRDTDGRWFWFVDHGGKR